MCLNSVTDRMQLSALGMVETKSGMKFKFDLILVMSITLLKYYLQNLYDFIKKWLWSMFY